MLYLMSLLESWISLSRVPGPSVQGRYDVVCPFRWAWDLHQAWPEADFKVHLQPTHYDAGLALSRLAGVV